MDAITTPSQTSPTGVAAATAPGDLKPLADDVQHAVAIAIAAVRAYKTDGVAGVTKQAPQVVAEVERDFVDVKAAVPTIKAGVKTTEFWLVAGFLAGNAVYVGLTGKTLPVDVDAVLGTVLSVYAGLRHVAKTSAQ